MSEQAPQASDFRPTIDEEGIADFTIERKRIRFRVDRDVFEAAPALPAEILMELMDLQGRIDQMQKDDPGSEGRRQFFADFFGKFLLKESLERFLARLHDLDHPIDLRQMTGIIPWIIEQYTGGLPLGQPTDSSAGSGPSPDGGTRSTADASSPVSTSAESGSIAS